MGRRGHGRDMKAGWCGGRLLLYGDQWVARLQDAGGQREAVPGVGGVRIVTRNGGTMWEFKM